MLFSLMIVKTIMAAVSSRSITVKVVLPMLLDSAQMIISSMPDMRRMSPLRLL